MSPHDKERPLDRSPLALPHKDPIAVNRRVAIAAFGERYLLATALDYLQRVGLQSIEAHTIALTDHFAQVSSSAASTASWGAPESNQPSDSPHRLREE